MSAMVDKWIQVLSEKDWRVLDAMANGFHDGFIKSLCWDTPDFVDTKTMELHFEGPTSVRLLVEMQNSQLPRLEMLLTDAKRCILSSRAGSAASCQFEKKRVLIKLLQIEELEAESIWYRVPTTHR
jgi:hypothetical protein